eukprot:CAMPEP_0197652280 /NCGR_PEP_ID=MMETSP1338-20131121/34352_1 /TAXON_ID=43686 ORGANISM="Pelagodinium beii, Strain RCC1491" /NCGR_SAMPLE_ID=MMETSP1338 /ASSEMBLY_ACC=CAM_ASM_000754 /LENGTH=183 /DNA_ID=CAMNT_0043227115 /DNA_START=50 /DNA_END=601 /DNA_ORIENTATION=-
MDFFKSFADKASAATTQAMDRVHERVDICKAGKKLLEDGGEAAMSIMIAKRTARAAISEDEAVLTSLAQTASMYEDAAAKLRRAIEAPCPEGVTGFCDFESQAEVYEARAKSMREAVALLEKGVQDAKDAAPSASAVEEDAMLLALVKGGEAKLMDGVHQGLDSVKKMSEAATQSCSGREGGA